MSVADFMSITGTDVEAANRWLEMANDNLERAVALFFGGSDVAPSSSSSRSSSSTTAPSQMYHSNNKSTEGIVDMYQDEVRRPDSVKRQRLVDNTRNYYALPKPVTTSAFGSGKGFKPANEKEKTLSVLFKAPLDIMFQGAFEALRDTARDERKWILVNLQCDSCFPCHTLNRDVWGDGCVKDLVSCSFFFWQQLDTSAQGQQFVERYKIAQYPHISVIDPRTGGIVWRHDGDFKTSRSLIEKLQDFVGGNAFPGEKTILPGRKRSSLGANGHNGQTGFGETNVDVSSIKEVDLCTDSEDHSGKGDVKVDDVKGISEALSLSTSTSTSTSALASSSSAAAAASSSSTSQESSIETSLIAPPSSDVERRLTGYRISDLLAMLAIDSKGLQLDPSVTSSEQSFIRMRFTLPNGKKVTSSFSTAAQMGSMLGYVATLMKDAAPLDARFELYYSFPKKSLQEQHGKDFKLTDSLGTLQIPNNTAFIVHMLSVK